MPRKIAHDNALISQLEELFIDPIFNQVLYAPRLLGQHTFSAATIDRFIRCIDSDHCTYIDHPYTREKFYINKAKELPENIIINDLLLVFSYCKASKIDEQTLRDTMVYFIKCFLVQQKKLNKAACLLNSKNEIHDILFKNLIELLEMNKEVMEILTSSNVNDLLQNHNCKLSDVFLNGMLLMSIKHNNQRLIKILSLHQFKIDVGLKDKKGKTSLLWACYHNQPQIAKILIDLGADGQVKDQKRKTPLFWACYHQEKTIVKMIMDSEGHINMQKKTSENQTNKAPLSLHCDSEQQSVRELAKVVLSNKDGVDIKKLFHEKQLLLSYHHKRHVHKYSNQPSTNDWILVTKALLNHHRRRVRHYCPVI